jgi:hypothetical protein
MIAGAAIGSTVYYLSPTNKSEDGKPTINWIKSVLMGLGATAIVPVLFVTTQSQLLDNIEINKCNFCNTDSSNQKQEKLTAPVAAFQSKPSLNDSTSTDSVQKPESSTTASKGSGNQANEIRSKTPYNPAAGYLVWFGYCVLAAAAGFGFIKSLISKIATAEELDNAKKQISSLKFEKDKSENQKLANLLADEQKAQTHIAQTNTQFKAGPQPQFVWPLLPPVIHFDDPQKGRFGGQSQANGKKLQAEVSSSVLPAFYSVQLSVITISGTPLTGDVIFFLHNSFSKIVRIVTAQNGIAKLDSLLAYGAFTIGVVTDYGKTLLELDLSDPDLGFPKEFRVQ